MQVQKIFFPKAKQTHHNLTTDQNHRPICHWGQVLHACNGKQKIHSEFSVCLALDQVIKIITATLPACCFFLRLTAAWIVARKSSSEIFALNASLKVAPINAFI